MLPGAGINIQDDFAAHYKTAALDLSGMLEHIGQPMELTPGLASCKALSRVVAALHGEGVTFSVTQRPPPSNTASSTSSTSANDADIVVRLRGMPYSAGEKELREFLAPLEPAEGAVHFILGVGGRASGDCMVELATEEEATAAMAKDREMMGTRYIECFRTTRAEMQAALGTASEASSALPDYDEKGVCIRMRGLPYAAKVSDIKKFFEGLAIKDGGVHLLMGGDGRPSGEAYVQFETPEDNTKAMDKNREKMGGRYVELFEETQGVMVRAIASRSSRTKLAATDHQAFGGYRGLGYGEEAAVVRVRGLPFSATLQDVEGFFKEFGVAERGVQLVPGVTPSKPSGEAYVEFTSTAGAAQALSKNRQSMGSRYLEVYASSRSEMMAKLRAAVGGGHGPGRGGPGPRYYGDDGGGRGYGRGYDDEPRGHRGAGAAMGLAGNNRYNPYGGGPPRGGQGGPGGYGGYGHGGYGAGPALDRGPHNGYGGAPGGAYGAGGPGGFAVDRAPGGFAGGAPGFGGPHGGAGGFDAGGGYGVAPGFGAPGQHGGPAGQPGGPGVHGPPGATVRLRGIPFRATIQDVHAFFMGYNFIPESCRIGTDGTGRASGDAWVSFATKEEASRAVMERNRQHLGSRYVELFQEG